MAEAYAPGRRRAPQTGPQGQGDRRGRRGGPTLARSPVSAHCPACWHCGRTGHHGKALCSRRHA
jgi:hypothetical protein